MLALALLLLLLLLCGCFRSLLSPWHGGYTPKEKNPFLHYSLAGIALCNNSQQSLDLYFQNRSKEEAYEWRKVVAERERATFKG